MPNFTTFTLYSSSFFLSCSCRSLCGVYPTSYNQDPKFNYNSQNASKTDTNLVFHRLYFCVFSSDVSGQNSSFTLKVYKDMCSISCSLCQSYGEKLRISYSWENLIQILFWLLLKFIYLPSNPLNKILLKICHYKEKIIFFQFIFEFNSKIQ